MIAFIRGALFASQGDSIIVETSGVGYKIFIPQSVVPRLPGIGEEILIHTHYYVREDGITLYGFLDEKELALFEILITISGIGPKVALGILGAMPAQQFVQAILQENLPQLTQLPGVGKKTAQRLIIELKDKLSKFWSDSDLLTDSPVTPLTTIDGTDAVLALVALGYQQREAKQAVNQVLKADSLNSTDTETLIKMALKLLL